LTVYWRNSFIINCITTSAMQNAGKFPSIYYRYYTTRYQNSNLLSSWRQSI